MNGVVSISARIIHETLCCPSLRDTHVVPSLFTVVPQSRSRFNPKNWAQEKFELRFYCEAEGSCHPSTYQKTIDLDRRWWSRVRPALSIGLKALALTIGPGLASIPLLDEAGFQEFKEQIGLAKELHKTLPVSFEGGEEAFDSFRDDRDPDGEDSEALRHRLAEFSLAMQELDPASAEALTWGDLRRIHMPDDKFRWLCANHRPG